MELPAVLRHKRERRIYFIIVSDIAVLIVIEPQKIELIDGGRYSPYQSRVQSEAVFLYPTVYFCHIHIDGNAVCTADVIVVVEKVFFSFSRVHIYF